MELKENLFLYSYALKKDVPIVVGDVEYTAVVLVDVGVEFENSNMLVNSVEVIKDCVDDV